MRDPGGMGALDWFSRKFRREEQDRREAGELFDDYHHRASITGPDDEFAVAPHKVLTNIDFAMERLDLDINQPVAIEDFAHPDELMMLVDHLRMGSMLLAHTANTAFRIMLARYPEDLVRARVPKELDVRKMLPLSGSDREHELARRVFNRRAKAAEELEETAPLPDVAGYDSLEITNGFMLLWAMYGLKLGALKRRTGIE